MPSFATFRGHPDPVKRGDGTPGLIKYCGITFPLNTPVEIGALTAPQKAKLLTNHHFEVVEQAAPEAAAPDPTPAPTQPPAGPRKTVKLFGSPDAAPAKLPPTPPAPAAVEASAAPSLSRPAGLTKAK